VCKLGNQKYSQIEIRNRERLNKGDRYKYFADISAHPIDPSPDHAEKEKAAKKHTN